MSIENKIQDRLVADTESILEDNLESVEKFFRLHEDGSINLSGDLRELKPEKQILAYLIAKRYAFEGGIANSSYLENSFFYDRFDKSKSTIRGYLKNLRDKSLTRSTEKGQEIIVENLPQSIKILDKSIKD